VICDGGEEDLPEGRSVEEHEGREQGCSDPGDEEADSEEDGEADGRLVTVHHRSPTGPGSARARRFAPRASREGITWLR
jgi:hypothetical protein